MVVKDDLGKRMKEFYEQIPKTRLMRRTPVAIRNKTKRELGKRKIWVTQG